MIDFSQENSFTNRNRNLLVTRYFNESSNPVTLKNMDLLRNYVFRQNKEMKKFIQKSLFTHVTLVYLFVVWRLPICNRRRWKSNSTLLIADYLSSRARSTNSEN